MTKTADWTLPVVVGMGAFTSEFYTIAHDTVNNVYVVGGQLNNKLYHGTYATDGSLIDSAEIVGGGSSITFAVGSHDWNIGYLTLSTVLSVLIHVDR